MSDTTKTHLTTYHNKNGLILQFIIFELISAHQELKQIHHALNKSSKTNIKRLMDRVIKLSGSSQKYMRIFTWNLHDGILTKLKDYCAFLAELNDKIDGSLIRSSDRTWVLSLQLLDTVRDLQENGCELSEFKELLDKVTKNLLKVGKQVVKMIPEYKKDENVLFFIVRYQEDLDNLFGTDFSRKLLEKLFPKGIRGAELFLQRKYAKRGFDHLLPMITKQLARL